MPRLWNLAFTLSCVVGLAACADAGEDPCALEGECDEQPVGDAEDLLAREQALLPPRPGFVNVNVVATPAGGGDVRATSNTWFARCSAEGCSVLPGASVSVSATPRAGYRFTGWSGCSTSTAASITLSARATTTCTASFTRVNFTVQALASGSGTVRASSSSSGASCTGTTCSVPAGASVTLSALPAQGYNFAGWTGCTVPSNGVLTNVQSNLTCVANFRQQPLTTVTATAFDAASNRPGGGQVWLGGNITTCSAPGTCSYPPGGTVQLQATPNAAMYFDRWAHGTAPCPVAGSTQPNIAFAANPGAPIHCVAQFWVILY